jgi:hypothetical protein
VKKPSFEDAKVLVSAAHFDWMVTQGSDPRGRGRITVEEALTEHRAWKRFIDAIEVLGRSKCWRCDGSGYDPETTDMIGGGPWPAACRDCCGTGRPDERDP